MKGKQETHSYEHGRMVAGLFGRIVGWYDFLNHFLSLGLDVYWRYRLARVLRAEQPGRVLDLAAGTLDVSLETLRQWPDREVIGSDFCLPMLLKGKEKIRRKGMDLDLICADGLTLSFQDESFDWVTIAFGIRNIRPRITAYEEILRVLKPGGKLCILEFGSGRTRIWKGIYNLYLKGILPVLGRFFSKDKEAYQYLAETIHSFPGPRELGRELMHAGFARVYHFPLSSGIVNIHVAQKK